MDAGAQRCTAVSISAARAIDSGRPSPVLSGWILMGNLDGRVAMPCRHTDELLNEK